MRAVTKWVQTGHYQVVGAALAAARQRANLTQVQLAKRLRKPQSAISAIEAGMRRVDLVEFLAIVRVLEGDPIEIFAEIVRSLPKLPRARREAVLKRLSVPKPPSTGVSFLITRHQKAELRERGFTDDQIHTMTPEEAHRLLGLVD